MSGPGHNVTLKPSDSCFRVSYCAHDVVVLVDVEVEVEEDVEVVVYPAPNQADPLYLALTPVSVLKYSSPSTGSVGFSVSSRILPAKF